MLSPNSAAIEIIILSYCVQSALGYQRFYSSAQCTGNYASFSASVFGACYSIQGTARSLYSNNGGEEHWVAFQKSSTSNCGQEVCSFNGLVSRCYTSAAINIKGAAVYSLCSTRCTLKEKMAERSRDVSDRGQSSPTERRDENTGRNDDGAQAQGAQAANPDALPQGGKKNEDDTFGCISIADAGGQGFVELPDGTYHGLGEGVVRVTEAELQRQLREKGIAPLPVEKIAELRVFGMVE